MSTLEDIDKVIVKYGGIPSDPILFVDSKSPIDKLRDHLNSPDPSRNIIVFTATQMWEVDWTGTMAQLMKKLGVDASEITAVESIAKDRHTDEEHS